MKFEDLQRRHDELRANLAALSEFKVNDENPLPFKTLVNRIINGSPDDVRHEAMELFNYSKTWRRAKYMKFSPWRFVSALFRGKKIGLLIRDKRS